MTKSANSGIQVFGGRIEGDAIAVGHSASAVGHRRDGNSEQPAVHPVAPSVESRDTRTVLVVYGRNIKARTSVFDFLRRLNLQPIEWSQAIALTERAAPYTGEVLDAAFAKAQAVVVLLTPDEIAYLRPEYADGADDPQNRPSGQPRPNVLFEAGMAFGRDPRRTILVELGDVRAFSDVTGRSVIRLNDSPQSRKEFAQRLAAAGCDADLTGEDWLMSGDLTPPEPPQGL